jgi:hypothetical protein
LEKDISQAFPALYQSVGKVINTRFHDSPIHQHIAKTVCVLQILGNLPISAQNVTSLMHGGISDPSSLDEAKKAVEELISDPIVPFGEKDGLLCFFSEKLNDIEQERATLALRSVELMRIKNEALNAAYSPLPSTHLEGNFAVLTGLKAQTVNGQISLSGDRHPIQTIVERTDPKEYETAKIRLTDESRHKTARQMIFLLGRMAPEVEQLTGEIYRSREIANRYRNEPDQEIKDYCNGQIDRANRLLGELERFIKRSLLQGSFIFRGEVTALQTLGQDVLDAARKYLGDVAGQVFDRYNEASVRVKTDVAEKFLRVGNLTGITSQLDPLGLVKSAGGQPSIDIQHKAIISIRDTIEQQGVIEGKRLIEIFTRAPFGWSQDTLRYLVAAMLIAGEIKLKVSGREITVNGQQAIDALKTNNTFKPVGISLRDGRPDPEILAKAATRLTELSGDMVIPLEDDISKATIKLFPSLQHSYGPLAEKLKGMKLPGVERLEALGVDIKDILYNDASDAARRLGGEDSLLYANLKWASELKRALDNGLEDTLQDLLQHCREIKSLPDSGTPGMLRSELTEQLNVLQERLEHPDFFKFSTDFASTLTALTTKVRDTVAHMQREQEDRIKEGERDLVRLPAWKELTSQERDSVLADLEELAVTAGEDLSGLRTLMNQEYTIQSQLLDLKQRVERKGQQRVTEKLKAEQEKAKQTGKTKITRTLHPQRCITSINVLDGLIKKLVALHEELQFANQFELTIEVADNASVEEK